LETANASQVRKLLRGRLTAAYRASVLRYFCFSAFRRQLRVREAESHGGSTWWSHVWNDFVCSSGPRAAENSYKLTYGGGYVLRIYPKIRAYLCNSTSVVVTVEFAAEITDEGVRTSRYAPVWVFLPTRTRAPIEGRSYVCIRRMRDRVRAYECWRVYVFSALLFECIVPPLPPPLIPLSPPCRLYSALFGLHVLPTIQFIRRIIPGNVENRGWLSPSLLFYLAAASIADPFFYVPASIAAKSRWLDRESIPRQHTSTAYLDSIELVLFKHGRSSRFFSPPQPIRSTRDSFSLLLRFNKIPGFIFGECACSICSTRDEISFFFPLSVEPLRNFCRV
jgi:hypothetical protein